MMKRFLFGCFAICATGCPADTAVDNNPPDLQLDTTTQLTHIVGEGLIRISATATDPDGDPVSISLAEAPERATLQDTGKLAVFTWDPIVSDVTPADEPPRKIVFSATDSRGGVTERTVRVEIVPGNGLPRFLEPAPTVLHRIDQEDAVQFDVEARDDDSAEVQITLVEGEFPPGAFFSQNSSFGGLFRWPVPEEAKQQRVHPVKIRVTDGQNPPQDLEVSIVLEKGKKNVVQPIDPADPTGCKFEDTVRHSPLGPQRGSEDYNVTVTVDEPYDAVTLYWSGEDAWNGNIEFESKAMEKEGNVYTGTIPNPLLNNGESKLMYYEICASDNDENEVICGPSHLYHGFVAYGPETEECIDDPGPPADTFDGGFYISSADSNIFSTHRTCPGEPDYHEFGIEPQQLLEVYVLGEGLEIEQYDEERNLESSTEQVCTGFHTYQFENNTFERTTKYIRVLGDERQYTIAPFYTELSSCTTGEEPNDDAGSATELVDGQMVNAQICPAGESDLYAITLQPGQVATIDATFVHADGDIDLELWPPSERGTIGDDETSVASEFSSTDDEQMVFTAQEMGTHFLKVNTYDGKETEYALGLSIGDSCQDDDGFAGNISEDTAAVVAYLSYPNLKLCPESADWFSVFALSQEIVTITATRTDGGSADDLFMNLWYNGTFYSFGTVENGAVQIDATFFETGEYFLQIVSNDEAEYDLVLSQTI